MPGSKTRRSNDRKMQNDVQTLRDWKSYPRNRLLTMDHDGYGALLRGGFERLESAESQSFQRQNALQAWRWALLLAGLANVSGSEGWPYFSNLESSNHPNPEMVRSTAVARLPHVRREPLRGHALSLRGLNRYVEAARHGRRGTGELEQGAETTGLQANLQPTFAAWDVKAASAWQRILDTLDQVLPASELSASVANDMLSGGATAERRDDGNKLLAFHLDYQRAANKEMRSALLRSHWAYGGGAAVWRWFSQKLFAPTVLEGGSQVWKEMQSEDNNLAPGAPDIGYKVVALPEAPRKETGRGFEDLLKRAQREKRDKVPEKPDKPERVPPKMSGVDGSEKSEKSTVEDLPTGSPSKSPGAGASSAENGAASCRMSTALEEDTLFVIAVVSLPGLKSASEAALEVSEEELRVESFRPELPHRVTGRFPVAVEPESSVAKWSRRQAQLTIRLRVEMWHILNVLDYVGLGIFIMLLALMAIPPTTAKVAPRIRAATMGMVMPTVYAFGRWQWFVNTTSSLLKETPSCEDKVEYYRNLRNTYLTFLLMFSSLMVIWVAHLKSEHVRQE
ncbi:Proton/sulfate cotransporter 2 [Durusdinium trenchii]|uniref:Proton/sulfate cotransporter 2 n=1 Tax=Durusdinium trenchii TaxID=1381693 RepID=A0ABP0SR28_9DINO